MAKTLGDALFVKGFRRTVWVSGADIRKHEFGNFNPAAPLNVLDKAAFEARYGAGSSTRKGDLVGERYAAFIVEDVIRHPSNPLNIDNNQGYQLRFGEELDVKLCTTGADASCYDTFFRPTHNQLFPQTSPTRPTTPTVPTTPTTQTTPTSPTVPTPTPTPTLPGPGTPVEKRVEELRVLLTDALSGFKIPWAKTGIEHFVKSQFVTLALTRSVQLYRKVMGTQP